MVRVIEGQSEDARSFETGDSLRLGGGHGVARPGADPGGS